MSLHGLELGPYSEVQWLGVLVFTDVNFSIGHQVDVVTKLQSTKTCKLFFLSTCSSRHLCQVENEDEKLIHPVITSVCME